jgi:biopolymer transport protein ExbB
MRTILIWYQSGGPFIVPLLLVGAAGLLLLAERIVSVVIRSKIHARPFMEKVISLVRGGKVEEALKLCADHQAALPDLGLVILRSQTREEKDLVSVAQSAALTMVPELTRRLAWLPTLAIISVTLGLLGALANLHDALLKTTPLGSAILFAIRPLGVGLLTAIPIVAGHAYLKSESQKLRGQLEEFSVRLVNALLDRPDVRLGHRS